MDIELGWILEHKVQSLLAKAAIELILPPERESRFYNRYFIVSKEYGGLRPILDLRHFSL